VPPSRSLAFCFGAKERSEPLLCGPMVEVKSSVNAGGGGRPRARGDASAEVAVGWVLVEALGVERILSKIFVKISRSRNVIDELRYSLPPICRSGACRFLEPLASGGRNCDGRNCSFCGAL